MWDMVGSMAAGAMNYFGAQSANRANRKMAREQMAFQQGSNREQMGFQERMSNTSYQRAMEDMRQAGLNPVLAYNQGGASSPGGASSSGSSANMVNELSGAMSSAIDARRANAEISNLHSQNQNLRAMNKQIASQTRLNNANSAVAHIAAEAQESRLPGLKNEQQIDESKFGQVIQFLQRLNPLSSIFKAIK